MKRLKIVILALAFLFLSFNAFAAQISSASYKQNVIVSVGGENVSSSSYKTNIAVGIINGIISSASYINNLGFFHTLLLADGQPCTSASQCEGGFCCSSVCKSSACPSAAAAAGGGGGGAAAPAEGGGSNITVAKIKDFSIVPSSIKEHIALGTEKTNSITIKNTGNTALSFNLGILTINDFVSLSDASFSLGPGQEKSVGITIIGRKLGSYLGEIEVSGDGVKKSVNVVVEVESEQVLFDVKIDVPSAYKEVEAGGDLKAQITLLNVGPARNVDVTPTYIIKDRLGKSIYESSETFAVEKQTSYVKSFRIPKDAQPGDYLAIVEVRYENSFAVSSELFRVVPKKAAIEDITRLNRVLTYGLIIFVGLVFLFVYLLIPKVNVLEKIKLRKFYRAINNAKAALDKNDAAKAKELYIEARNLYINLDYREEKDVYNDLMDVYDAIKNR